MQHFATFRAAQNADKILSELAADQIPPEPKVPIEGIVTSCRDCVFAQYEGNEQTGCDWDRLDKFEQEGAEIIGQDNGDRKYFLVSGRFCNACRYKTWGAEHPRKDWYAIVADEFQVRCCFIVYIDEGVSDKKTIYTLLSALDQGPVQPSELIILLNHKDSGAAGYVTMLRDMKVSIPWQVVRVSENGMSEGDALDIAVKSIKISTYYSFVKNGEVWPSNFLVTLNHHINYEMKRITAVLPDKEGEAFTMMTNLHNKLLGGNKERPVVEKLLEAAEAEGTSHTIKRYGELYESDLCNHVPQLPRPGRDGD